MKYTWILFDADGTLFDFERAEAEALRDTFTQLRVAFDSAYTALYHRHNAEVWAEFERGLIGADELKAERFRRTLRSAGLDESLAPSFSRAYLPNLARGTHLLPGAQTVIDHLRGRYRLGLVTNGLADVQRPRIAASSLAGAFDVLVISEEIGVAKPHAGYFDVAFERMGTPPRQTVLIVGDSLSSDIRGGLDYGLDTCWYNPRSLAADPACLPRYTIRSLDELPGLLSEAERSGE